MTPTRRFAPTSPFQGKVECAEPYCQEVNRRASRVLFPPPERAAHTDARRDRGQARACNRETSDMTAAGPETPGNARNEDHRWNCDARHKPRVSCRRHRCVHGGMVRRDLNRRSIHMTKTARMFALGAVLMAASTLPAMAAEKTPPPRGSSISSSSYDLDDGFKFKARNRPRAMVQATRRRLRSP
jgi:hypothetical protein